MSFHLFLNFPTEIHSLILASCLPNDEICLRLTTKYLYKLPPSLPYRGTNNYARCYAEALPSLPRARLINQDRINICNHPSSSDHTWECHALLKLEHDRQRAITNGEDLEKVKMMEIPSEKEREKFMPWWRKTYKYGPGVRGCNTRQGNIHGHCECFDFPLHKRLSSWIKNTPGGQNLRFCGHCNHFTKRNRAHQYQCSHGRRRVPKQRGEYLTWRRRRNGQRGCAFARRGEEWKKGFNNLAMDRLESRLRYGAERRCGTARYDMRIIKPVDVNTRNIRGAMTWRS